MIFEWDPAKAEADLVKHGVSFEEAATVLDDPLAQTFDDPDHSESEHRFLTFGVSRQRRALVVGHCDRPERVRIITARPMTRREKRQHEKGTRQAR
ncbi:hypothetical protein MYXO_01144 [Myxococcaceae bacterium]|nr:hypothetical protein MYXO_01144 [Myxococcaceae bacterium]